MTITPTEKTLSEKAAEIAESDRACDFCENNVPFLLVCNKQCQQGIYERLRKQGSK